MTIRQPRVAFALIAAAAVSLAGAACQKVPLLAPSGSTITIIASASVLPMNGTTDITAQVVEPSGTPPHSGTRVTFTTTLGSIQPQIADTDINGQATVKFTAGGSSGTATITAISGGVSAGANGAVKIVIGSAAVGRVALSATPSLVPSSGGSSTIEANVIDVNGNPLTSVPVAFSTTAGSLGASIVNSDQSGIARTTLTTATQATVTASVGAQGSAGGGTTPPPTTGGGEGTTPPTTGGGNTSGTASATVTVGILGAPQLVITPPTTAPGAGLPGAFTFAVTVPTTNGSSVRNVRVNWGDGQVQDLGAISGSAVVTHVYTEAKTYTVTATITDNSGNSVDVGTSVTVVPTSRPTIIITPSVQTASRSVTFQIEVTPPSGVGISSAVLNFGDGTAAQQLGGLNGTTSVTHTYPATGTSFPVTLTVTDTLGVTTVGTATVTF